MNTKKIKKQIKIDLLEMDDYEKTRIISELKQSLRQTVMEAKLLNYLLQCETVTVNGQVIFSNDCCLNGILIQQK